MGILDVKMGSIQEGTPVAYKKKAKREIDGLRGAMWKAPRKARSLTKLPSQAYHGVKFERAWVDYMYARRPEFKAGPWIYYEDANGWGYCQPDGILRTDDCLYLFECKLTFTYRTAYNEMSKLYAPLLSHLYKISKECIKHVQVCRHLKPSAKRTTVVYSLDEVLKCQKKKLTWAWRPSL